ncbi:hypothetical protein DVB37_23590 [Achromobacter sp. B7]|nr:hypothetical protein DVB37_23590 [Achromobacter sp. B7]
MSKFATKLSVGFCIAGPITGVRMLDGADERFAGRTVTLRAEPYLPQGACRSGTGCPSSNRHGFELRGLPAAAKRLEHRDGCSR